MNALAAFHLRVAAIYVALGMVAGIVMAASQHFEYGPAHGHLNLLGFASAAIYGLVLKDRPDLAATRLAKVHAILAHLGLVVMTIGPPLWKKGWRSQYAVGAASENLALMAKRWSRLRRTKVSASTYTTRE